MEKINAHAASLKKVVIIGPESTGKSTLSTILARHYRTSWVPEYARQYLHDLTRAYKEQDLVEIAKGQLKLEDQKLQEAEKLLICDTDLIVIKIWSEHKYGRCHPVILDEIRRRHYDLYLLTNIDLPWEDDPLREHPDLREYFYDLFKAELSEAGKPFVEISGDFLQRKQLAVQAVDQLLRDQPETDSTLR